MILVADYSVLN